MALALWYTSPGTAELQPSEPGEGPLTIQTEFSAISRGTERLVFSGQVPESEWERMRAPAQEGAFPFPVKYGYAAVGRVVQGPLPEHSRLFSLYPHQDTFRSTPEMVVPVPDNVPSSRAALAANMETALNALWDAELARPARVAVIGAGLVGCLTAYLARTLAQCDVVMADHIPQRSETASELRVSFVSPHRLTGPFDVVFHTSASSAGLALALAVAGFEGKVIELSWYGNREVTVPLGAAFHANRLRLISSQVGHVAPSRRSGTTHRDRLAEAIALLSDPVLDCLITRIVPFEDLPRALPDILAPDADGIATLVRYESGQTT